MKELVEAIDSLGYIVDEANNLIYLLQEIDVQLEKLDRKSRQLKEDALHARNVLRTMLWVLLTGG